VSWLRLSPPLVLNHDGGSLLMVFVDLVNSLVVRDDLVHFLDAWNDFVLGLVILVNHGFMDFHNVEIVLVQIMLMDLVFVDVVLMNVMDVKVMLVEMVTENQFLVFVVLVNLMLVMVMMMNLVFMSVIIVNFVNVFVSLGHFWRCPSPPLLSRGGFPTPPTISSGGGGSTIPSPSVTPTTPSVSRRDGFPPADGEEDGITELDPNSKEKDCD